MAVMKIGDLVLLDEEFVFQVVNTVEYDGENYLFGFKVPKEIEDAFDVKELKNVFLKEIVEEETEECYVEEVQDEGLIKILTEHIVIINGLKKIM